MHSYPAHAPNPAPGSNHGISGAKGRKDRPQFDDLLHAVARKEFDVVAAWSVNRLGRSLQDLVGSLSDLQSKKTDLYLHQQAFDTSTPSGKARRPSQADCLESITMEGARDTTPSACKMLGARLRCLGPASNGLFRFCQRPLGADLFLLRSLRHRDFGFACLPSELALCLRDLAFCPNGYGRADALRIYLDRFDDDVEK